MAGIIQTLLVTTPPSKSLSYSHRVSPNLNFRFSRLSVRACHRSDQTDGDGIKAYKSLDWAKPVSNFVTNNFLPLALVGGVALGFACPSPGCLADSYSLSKFSTFGIFVISGLTLHTGEIIAAADAWPVGLFGLVSILLFTPYISMVILQLQLQPQEFVTGLAIGVILNGYHSKS